MARLTKFEIDRYRGLGGLTLDRLTDVNLITGPNGVGKTALIEAMWLFLGRGNGTLFWNVNVRRSLTPVVDPITGLTRGAIRLKGVEDGVTHSWDASYETLLEPTRGSALPQSPPTIGRINMRIDNVAIEAPVANPTPRGLVLVPARHAPITSLINGTHSEADVNQEQLTRFSDLIREGQKDSLVRAMNLILPKVQDVQILADEFGNSYVSMTTQSGEQRPLRDHGNGAAKLFGLYLNLSAARQGVLLIDEMDNGIHYSALAGLWTNLREWLKEWNVQLVATTHSAECLDAAMAAFSESTEELSIHRLYSDKAGKVEAVTFTGEALEGARDLDLEVR